MENTKHFGALTERMQAFREEVLDEKPYIDAVKRCWMKSLILMLNGQFWLLKRTKNIKTSRM